jgi:hypothetical protein
MHGLQDRSFPAVVLTDQQVQLAKAGHIKPFEPAISIDAERGDHFVARAPNGLFRTNCSTPPRT